MQEAWETSEMEVTVQLETVTSLLSQRHRINYTTILQSRAIRFLEETDSERRVRVLPSMLRNKYITESCP